ncbi:MAG: hypothetical protein ACRD5R_04375 [Candidatus Acidiferrales bacterium]
MPSNIFNPRERAVPRKSRRLALAPAACALLFAALLFCSRPAFAQDAKPAERVYNHPQIEVQKALDSLHAYDTERLPVLDGFVNANASTLDHFENPHYQFRIDIEAQNPAQTLIVVSAKITAWFAEDDPSKSQYVVIPSNGRLESDFLDRLSIYLEKGRPAPSAPPDAASVPLAAGAPPADAPAGESSSSQPSAQPPDAASPPSSAPAAPAAPSAAASSSDPAAIASQISSVRAQRAAVEEHERKLQQQISELRSVSQNQKFLPDIAVVRSAQTPVFSTADETSQILFRADPDDEFEILGAQTRFVHVKLEKGDGWIRIGQLRGPNQVDDADESTGDFNASNEEIKPFEGEWAALKGKPTLFVFAQPARKLPPGTLGQTQMDFAKHMFTEGYREAAHTQQSVDGVVVVFLGEKGGVAAATLPDIRRWHDGVLPEKQFLEKCSFDPPESFRDSARR